MPLLRIPMKPATDLMSATGCLLSRYDKGSLIITSQVPVDRWQSSTISRRSRACSGARASGAQSSSISNLTRAMERQEAGIAGVAMRDRQKSLGTRVEDGHVLSTHRNVLVLRAQKQIL
jgi:hypothetical protein